MRSETARYAERRSEPPVLARLPICRRALPAGVGVYRERAVAPVSAWIAKRPNDTFAMKTLAPTPQSAWIAVRQVSGLTEAEARAEGWDVVLVSVTET